MGCVHSKVEDEEAVRRCKERKRLMKQLLRRRAELAAAHIAYLQSLRNTGSTLRQFAEVESALPLQSPISVALPPSPLPPPPPPPPLSVPSSMPPSPRPPPPPPFSPIRKERKGDDLHGEDSIDGDDSDSCATPLPPPPLPGSAWDFLDPFGPSHLLNFPSPLVDKKGREMAAQVTGDEDNWAETNTEFGEEVQEDDETAIGNVDARVSGIGDVDASVSGILVNPAKGKALADDNSSMVSWVTKDSDTATVTWRSKKTLIGIVKDIDDYFLKAAASGKDVVILLDSTSGRPDPLEFEGKKGKNSKSAKVFSTLSWSWSFKSPQANREASLLNSSDDCRYGYHAKTLEKLYDEEQKLYKEVKEEEFARLQYKKNSSLLQRLESGEHDKLHIEKVRDNVEELQIRIVSLEESVNSTCLSISKLRDEELYPQLIELSASLVHMWRIMYECHQVQSHIGQQASILGNHVGNVPTTDSHCHATTQLEAEVTSWHSSFCNLINLQREYVRILNQWIKLTDCLPDNDGFMSSSSGIRNLCEELQRALDRLPEKVAAEAIKTFLSVIHSIVTQQTEERQLKKKVDRLEGKLHSQLEKHSENVMKDSAQPAEMNHHSISKETTKLEVFKKRVEEEKTRYLNSVRRSRAMTLSNLQTSLPNVFQALMGFSGVCLQAFEGIGTCSEVAGSHSGAVSPTCS